MEINGEVVAPDADIIEFYKKSYTAELFTLLSYKPLDIFYDFMLEYYFKQIPLSLY